MTQFDYGEIAAKVTDGRQDEVSENDLEKWILSKVETFVDSKVNEMNVHSWVNAQSKLNTKINQKINQAFQRIENEIKSTAS